MWQVTRNGQQLREYIVPKGTVEMIFDFSRSSTISANIAGNVYMLPRCFINGFNRSPIQLLLPTQQEFFGVQLLPVAVKKILRTPANQFTDVAIDLSLIDNGIDSLWHLLAEEQDFDLRVKIINDWIYKKLINLSAQENELNQFLCAENVHDLSVPDLSKKLYYSTRHLSRKIQEATGLNTEEILQYKKFQRAIHLIHTTDLSLTQIAYQSNFSDQSHFIKCFKNYAKLTPGDYSKKKGTLKAHLYESIG